MNVEHHQSRTRQVWAYNNLMNESHLWGKQKINDKEKSNERRGGVFCLSKKHCKALDYCGRGTDTNPGGHWFLTSCKVRVGGMSSWTFFKDLNCSNIKCAELDLTEDFHLQAFSSSSTSTCFRLKVWAKRTSTGGLINTSQSKVSLRHRVPHINPNAVKPNQ